MAENKHFAFVLKPDTARALLAFLHEIEIAKGQRTTWTRHSRGCWQRLAGRSSRRTLMQIELSEREAANVMAALRNWQTDTLNEDLADAFAGHFEDHAPLDDDEVDALCERLNFAGEQVVKGAA